MSGTTIDDRDTEEEYDAREREAERLHDRAIDYCYVLHDYDKAVEEIKKAIALRESVLGKYNNDTALSYFRLSSILYECKKELQEALTVARREIRISQLILETPLPGSHDMPRGSKSEELLADRIRRISNIFREIKGASKPEIVEYCSHLVKSIEHERIGDVFFAEQDYETAITKYNFALTLESSSFGKNLSDMADLSVKVGDCWFEMGHYESATEEYLIAESRYKTLFGERHTTVANTLSKMASVHVKLNQYDDALGNFAKAYSVYESTFGKDHPISDETLQDIRLVTIKEMEYLRQKERERMIVTEVDGSIMSETTSTATDFDHRSSSSRRSVPRSIESISTISRSKSERRKYESPSLSRGRINYY